MGGVNWEEEVGGEVIWYGAVGGVCADMCPYMSDGDCGVWIYVLGICGWTSWDSC